MRKAASTEAASGIGRDPGKGRKNSDMGFTGTASRSIIRPSGPAAQRPSGPAARVAPRGGWLHRLARWRPDAPTGRTRARPGRLLAVPALLLAALPPFAAAPAAADVLVSNLAQTRAARTASTRSTVYSTGFATGSEYAGYALSSIETVWSTGGGTLRTTCRAELWSDDGGEPNAKIADLTVPATGSYGVVAFAAPSNTTLTASTTYHLVVYTVGDFSPGLAQTSSDDEDSGSATGWTIANASEWVNRDTPGAGPTWTTDHDGASLAIRVNGVGGDLVTLEAKPNPVEEGRLLTVRVRVSDPVVPATWLPVVVRSGTAATHDWGREEQPRTQRKREALRRQG